MLRNLFSLFPAYAGVILLPEDAATLKAAFPRIRGGDPTYLNAFPGYECFSPHTRG